MYVALYHKFTQHHALRGLLLDTGDAELKEVCLFHLENF